MVSPHKLKKKKRRRKKESKTTTTKTDNKTNRNCCLEGKKIWSSYFGRYCGTIKSKYTHRHHFFISPSWGITRLNQLIKRSNNASTHTRVHVHTHTHARTHTMASSLPFVMKNVLGVCFSFFLPSGELVSNFAPSASSSPGNTMLWKAKQKQKNSCAHHAFYTLQQQLGSNCCLAYYLCWATEPHNSRNILWIHRLSTHTGSQSTGKLFCFWIHYWFSGMLWKSVPLTLQTPAPRQAVLINCIVATVGWHFKHAQKWKRMLFNVLLLYDAKHFFLKDWLVRPTRGEKGGGGGGGGDAKQRLFPCQKQGMESEAYLFHCGCLWFLYPGLLRAGLPISFLWHLLLTALWLFHFPVGVDIFLVNNS